MEESIIKSFKVGDVLSESSQMVGIERIMIILGKKRKSHLKSMKIG